MLYVCLALFALSTATLVIGTFRLISDVPAEDRSYLDRPPLGFLLLWPLVRFVAYWIAPLLSVALCNRTQKRLQSGGAEFALSVEQFFAGKVLCAIVFGTLLTIVWMGDGTVAVVPLVAACALGFVYPDIWLKEQIRKRHKAILKVLPFYLDIITLGVEAGLSLTMAIAQAVEKCPPGFLASELGRFLRDMRAGRTRSDSLRQMEVRVDLPAVTKLVSSIITAENMGASMGQALRLQSEQRRIERFQRAEKLALEAPVKMLGPLIMFIFPNTFIVIGFPLVMKIMHDGL